MVVLVVSLRGLHTQSLSNSDGNVVADLVQLEENVLLDSFRLQLACLKTNGVDEELLFSLCQRVVEETWLAPVVREGGRSGTNEVSGNLAAWGSKEALALSLVCLSWVAIVQSVGSVCSS